MDPALAKVVAIGGGNGLTLVLRALNGQVSRLTGIVNVTDNGSSSGRLRQMFGVLPPGDVRRCLGALCPDAELVEALEYRFDDGPFAGHPVGNVLLVGFQKVTGEFGAAVALANRTLQTTGTILPVTTDDVQFGIRRASGEFVLGQVDVTATELNPREVIDCFLAPPARIDPAAIRAIVEADLIIVGPGNLYSTLMPMLLTEGMADAFRSARARKLFVCNLVQFLPHTRGFQVHDYVAQLERYVGSGTFDLVLYNTTRNTYGDPEDWVNTDVIDRRDQTYQPVGASLASSVLVTQSAADYFMTRNPFRHDPIALQQAVLDIIRVG